ncbi:MAG TPA: VOC family protein [Candidatus Paceibacterota bacterium]|nr:VOC family protein [Candidatus Paceibacterota bacterium]
MVPVLNHVISFADVRNVDQYLRRYKKAGFSVNPQTIRHAPGKRNGFVDFGPDYIEFFWVEDEKEFNAKGAYQKFFRENPRPFGIAFDSKNVDAFHKRAIKNGFKLKPTWSKAMKEADDEKPWWAFQDIPLKSLPGAWSFMLTYLRRDWEKVRTVSIPPNTIYGLTGITFITKRPGVQAARWRDFLGGTPLKLAANTARFVLGPHSLEWMTDSAYVQTYGAVRSPVNHAEHANMQEIALIHLVAADIARAGKMLKANGFRTTQSEKGLFIKPDTRDGFAFLVTEENPKAWLKTRAGFGQKLALK